MGAIISRKKGTTEKNVRRKTQAVQAFSKSSSRLNEPTPRSVDLPESEDSNRNEGLTKVKSNGTVNDTHAWGSSAAKEQSSTATEVDKGSVSDSGRKDQDAEAATTIQSYFRGYKDRKQLHDKKDAALVIQKHVRGHQVRQAAKKDKEAAIKIQRGFRNFLGKKDRQTTNNKDNTLSETEAKERDRPWRKVSATPKMPKMEIKMGEKTKESFENYQEDISALRWQGEQQQELTTLGDDYRPQKILLIASNIQETDALVQAVLEDVRCIVYDFARLNFQDLQEEVYKCLTEYREGSRAKMLGIVSQGEPGVVYILKGKAITLPKLETDSDLTKFISCIGTLMSKLDPANTFIHFVGNNVAGNKKGQKLLKELEKAARPSKVKFESVIYGIDNGTLTLEQYFDIDKYIAWKKLKQAKAKDKF